LSVSKYQVPIQWAYKLKKNNILKPISKKYLKYRSQELSTTFFDSGQFVIYPISYFKKKKMDKNFMGYVLPQEKSIDIDNIDDWKLAEITYRGIKKSLK
jgi:N-acylneuraminate cytidylyltransferase